MSTRKRSTTKPKKSPKKKPVKKPKKKTSKEIRESLPKEVTMLDVGSQESRYRKAFQKMDADSSGFITTDELQDAMNEVGLKLTVSQIEKMLADADANDDGEIDYSEFCEMMERSRTFKNSSAWQKAYDLFVGEAAITNTKKGFLRDVGEGLEVVSCCDRFVVNMVGQYVDLGLMAASMGIYAVLVLWVLFAQNSPNVLAYLMGIRFVKEGTTERAGGCSMLVYFVLSVPLGITMMPCCACFGKKQLLVEHCLKVQLVKKDMNIA